MKIEFKGYFFIVTSNSIVKQLGHIVSLGTTAMGLTVFPFIFVRTDTRNHEGLVRHETVHIRQQIELLLIGALLLYLLEYCYARFIKGFDARQSYYFTAMEQEAHRNTKNMNYLNERRPYAVLRYILDKKWLARGPAGELIEKDY